MKTTRFLLAAGLVVLPGAARAEGESRLRFLVGLQAASQGLEGDLDGHTALSNGAETIAVPEVDRHFTGGATVGLRRQSDRKMDPGFEIYYQQGSPDGHFLGSPVDLKYRALGADFKLYFNPSREGGIHPFLTVGFFIPWLRVEDGAATITQTADADFTGFGWQLGGGASLPMGDRFALNFTAAMRLLGFAHVDGVNDNYEIEDGLGSVDFTPSVALHFFLN